MYFADDHDVRTRTSYSAMDTLDESDKTVISVETLIRCVVLSIIGVVCVVGNFLVIRTLIFFKYPKIHLYVMIGGLAIADLLKITLEIPSIVIRWTEKGDAITAEWCQAIFYVVQTSTYSAACHLVALSIIRCIMLTDRTHYSKSYVIHAFISSIVIWVLLMLANIPNAKSIVKDELEGCFSLAGLNDETERNDWLKFAFSYVLPLLVIGTVYIITWYFTQRFFADSYSHREKRLSRLVTMLIISFCICKLPYEILTFVVFYQVRTLIYHNTKITYNDLTDDTDLQGARNQNATQFHDSNSLFDDSVDIDENGIELWWNLYQYSMIFAMFDLALRPIFYGKLSLYFSKSFDEVINCTTCRDNDKHLEIREGAVRINSQNGPSLTPLTIESPDIVYTFEDGAEGGEK